jgi:hypothetical protein
MDSNNIQQNFLGSNTSQNTQISPDQEMTNNKSTNNSNQSNTNNNENISQPTNDITVNNIEILAKDIIPTTEFFLFNSSPPSRITPLANLEKGDCYKTKGINNLRVYQQNIHGLQARNQNKWEGVLDRTREMQVDILGLCETCVNMGNQNIQKKFKDTIARKTPGGSLTASVIPTNYKKSYLPGGTLNLTVGKWRSYLDGKILDEDNLARWSGNSYRLSTTSKLHIISAYRVCEGKPEQDRSLSSYNQQYMGLKTKGIDNPDPRQQFISDLIITIKKLKNSENDKIIIGLDANADINTDKNGLQKLCNSCDLVDMYTTIHEDYENFPTHSNGSKRIDYMLCSTNVLPYVNKVGYIKFHEGLVSDHRAIFCDIDESILEDVQDRKNNILERLIGTNSTNHEGEKYIREVDNFCKYHRIYEKVDRMYNQVEEGSILDNDHIMEELDKIDELLTRGMLASEKHNCKRKPRTMWSPKLSESHLTVQLWTVADKAYDQQIDATDRLNQILTRLSDDTIQKIKANTLTFKEALDESIKQHEINLKDHFKLRMEHLENLVEDYNARSETNKGLTIKSLLRREKTRNDFQKLRQVFKPKNTSGLSTIEIQDPENPDNWILITIPTIIETELIKRNIIHFGQANESILASPSIQSLLGYEGTNLVAQNLIFNQVWPEEFNDLPKYVKEILLKLGDGQQLKQIPNNITFEEFCNGFKVWRERTTTSPSGRHLGHYKLLLRLQIFDKEDNDINLSMKLMHLYYKITAISAYLGTPLKRWKNVSTCMIQKDKNSTKINRLRVIHLYEADYNLILKIVWARNGIWNAHNKNALNDGQAGSRPGKRAIEVVIKK